VCIDEIMDLEALNENYGAHAHTLSVTEAVVLESIFEEKKELRTENSRAFFTSSRRVPS
jgi:hypothetical protein